MGTVAGFLGFLLATGCEVQIGGTGYHRLPPYFWPMPTTLAQCTRRGSADEVWPIFWPLGVEAAILEIEDEIEGTWSVTEDCARGHHDYTIVVGPSRRSDFGLLNGGCADAALGEVPGQEKGLDRSWDVIVRRGGGLEIGKVMPHTPHVIGMEANLGYGLRYTDGRWQREGCVVTARRSTP